MKEIVILLVTFLGICKGFAQGPAGSNATDSLRATIQKIAADTLAAKEKATVKLYPNPAKNKTELQVSGFEPGPVQLQLTDINGKRFRDDQRLLASGNETIVMMFALQPGIYFINVKQKERSVKKKLIVQ